MLLNPRETMSRATSSGEVSVGYWEPKWPRSQDARCASGVRRNSTMARATVSSRSMSVDTPKRTPLASEGSSDSRVSVPHAQVNDDKSRVRLTIEAFSSERQKQHVQNFTTLQAQGCAERSEGCLAQEPCAQGGTNAIQSKKPAFVCCNVLLGSCAVPVRWTDGFAVALERLARRLKMLPGESVHGDESGDEDGGHTGESKST